MKLTRVIERARMVFEAGEKKKEKEAEEILDAIIKQQEEILAIQEALINQHQEVTG